MVDTRSARQQMCILRWMEAKARGTLSLCTGFGKSYIAMQIAQRMLSKNDCAVIHIIVPTIFLQAQFYKEIKRLGLNTVECFVINTYCRSEHTCDLLIVDEVHLFLSEESKLFSKLFTICSYTWALCLSATLTDEEQQKLSGLGLPVVDSITMQEALQEGWISNHKTYNYGVELSFDERQEYDKYNDLFNSKFAYFGHDFSLAMSCMASSTARKSFAHVMGWNEAKGKADRWSPQSIGASANMWRMATQKRQDIVNHASEKYKAAFYLLTKFEVKAICFSESTTFATELAKLLPDICRPYHTNVESEERTYTATKSFKTKPDEVTTKTKKIGKATLLKEHLQAYADPSSPVRAISAARALDQGADFAGLVLGIETSGSGTIRQKVQRTGRVVRKEKDVPLEQQMAVYVHIFCRGTYEEGKLRRKQKGIMNVQVVKKIDEITFN